MTAAYEQPTVPTSKKKAELAKQANKKFKAEKLPDLKALRKRVDGMLAKPMTALVDT